MQVTCSCGKVLSVPEKLAGKSARCPACKKILQMPGAAPADTAPTRIMIECSCGKKLAAPAAAAGKKVACPKCNKELTVPGPTKAPAAKAPSSVPPGGSQRGAPKIVPMPGAASHKVTVPTRPGKLPPASNSNEDLSFDVEAAPPEALKAAALPDEEPASAHAEYGVGNPKCPNCKADLAYGAQFCVECGTSLATGAVVKTMAKPGVKKKWSLRDLRDLDTEDWKRIAKYGAIVLLLGLVYWWIYKPHGMTPEEQRRQAQGRQMERGPDGAPGGGRGGGGRGFEMP